MYLWSLIWYCEFSMTMPCKLSQFHFRVWGLRHFPLTSVKCKVFYFTIQFVSVTISGTNKKTNQFICVQTNTVMANAFCVLLLQVMTRRWEGLCLISKHLKWPQNRLDAQWDGAWCFLQSSLFFVSFHFVFLYKI